MSPMIQRPLTVEHALLGFLRQRPRHGYEIHQQLTSPAGLGAVWRLKQSLLYALLTKLEDAGLVTATLKSQETRPARRVFRLTKAGQEAFERWVQSPVPHGRDLRLEFLAKLYFAQREGPTVAMELLERQRAACEAWLKVQRERASLLHHSQPDEWLVCQYRIGQMEATLRWLELCEATVTASPD